MRTLTWLAMTPEYFLISTLKPTGMHSLKDLEPKDAALARWVLDLVKVRLQVQAVVFEFCAGEKTGDFANWRIPMIQV